MPKPIDLMADLLHPAEREARRCLGTGLHFCPICKAYYTPLYATKRMAEVMGNTIAKEQHISGICSSECWDEVFTLPDPKPAKQAEVDGGPFTF